MAQGRPATAIPIPTPTPRGTGTLPHLPRTGVGARAPHSPIRTHRTEHKPRRIPSASRAAGETGCPQGSNGAKRSGNWRELIKKVWEADPLVCPRCSRQMKIVALIDDRAVIEPWLRLPSEADRRRRDDPFPDYDAEQVCLSSEALA